MSSLVTEETQSNISNNSSTQSSRYKIKLSQMTDRKIVIVPIVYMLLQVWGIAADIGIYFLSTDAQTNYRGNAVSSILVFVSVSNSFYSESIEGNFILCENFTLLKFPCAKWLGPVVYAKLVRSYAQHS